MSNMQHFISSASKNGLELENLFNRVDEISLINLLLMLEGAMMERSKRCEIKILSAKVCRYFLIRLQC
jgi:hypothetical protein